jgi:hypothetical protein
MQPYPSHVTREQLTCTIIFNVVLYVLYTGAQCGLK